MPPPPPVVRRRRQGTRGPPPHPPPSHSGPRADGGGPKKQRPHTPPEEAAAPGVRGHHGRGRHPHALPAAGRQRTGDAQDGANEAALSEAGPGKTGARTRAGGLPPPPPRRTDPSAADRTAPDARGRPATPTARHGGNGRQADARRGGGAGGRPPRPPPPAPPPARGPQERPPAPPEARGTPPSQKGPRRGGGGCGWTCSRGGHGRGASPHERAGATRATEQYGGRAPHHPPVTRADSGRAEGGFRSAGAPGGAVHGPPLTPPHPGAALRPRPHAHAGRECADDTKGARIEYRRPPPRRRARRPRRDPPPPTPPPARKPRGPRPPPPEAGGMPPPRPREEPERDPPPRPSCRLPRGPRRTSEPAPTRQDTAQIAPSEGG